MTYLSRLFVRYNRVIRNNSVHHAFIEEKTFRLGDKCGSTERCHSCLDFMLVKTFGSAVHGVETITITIEVYWVSDSGKDHMIVGLPDNAVKESLQRIESTFKTNNYRVPRTKVVVNMAPADIRKSGTPFDLWLL